MTVDALRLDEDELWLSLQGCDPVAIASRAFAEPQRHSEPLRTAGRVGADRQSAAPTGSLLLRAEGGRIAVAPSHRLGTLWGATVAAAAAHALVPTDVVTAGLLIEGGGATEYLALLRRALPDLSHVLIGTHAEPDPALAARSRAYGVGVGYTTEPSLTFRGSTVVITHGVVWRPGPQTLRRGSVLIEVGGHGFEGPVRAARLFSDQPRDGELGLGELLRRPPGRHDPSPVVVRVRSVPEDILDLVSCIYRTALMNRHGNPPERRQ